MDSSIRLFVYDNLRQHGTKHRLLNGAKPVKMQSWTTGELLETEDEYPIMVDNPVDRVYGEVYDIQKKHFDDLSAYLKSSGMNGKITEKLIQTDGGQTKAYTFVYPKELNKQFSRVDFGDWKTYQQLKNNEFLYFAYGSCMDDERMVKAGVDDLFKQVEGRGILPGYSLGYTIHGKDGGRADIIEKGKGAVEGKVYRVDKDAMHYLFAREGVKGERYRPAFIDLQVDNEMMENVLTFIVLDKQEEIAPPEHYALEILRGAEGLVSDEYYEKLHTNLLDKFQMSVPVKQFS